MHARLNDLMQKVRRFKNYKRQPRRYGETLRNCPRRLATKTQRHKGPRRTTAVGCSAVFRRIAVVAFSFNKYMKIL